MKVSICLNICKKNDIWHIKFMDKAIKKYMHKFSVSSVIDRTTFQSGNSLETIAHYISTMPPAFLIFFQGVLGKILFGPIWCITLNWRFCTYFAYLPHHFWGWEVCCFWKIFFWFTKLNQKRFLWQNFYLIFRASNPTLKSRHSLFLIQSTLYYFTYYIFILNIKSCSLCQQFWWCLMTLSC